jgi:hypothetical protein
LQRCGTLKGDSAAQEIFEETTAVRFAIHVRRPNEARSEPRADPAVRW